MTVAEERRVRALAHLVTDKGRRGRRPSGVENLL